MDIWHFQRFTHAKDLGWETPIIESTHNNVQACTYTDTERGGGITVLFVKTWFALKNGPMGEKKSCNVDLERKEFKITGFKIKRWLYNSQFWSTKVIG